METLLELTGLRKPKLAAINLFKSGLAFQKMSIDDRKANVFSLNRTFLGNPGTGKTTVARLYARILFDSGMRKKETFIESSAQKLKDEGADKFRELIESALDGTLFIDEAYDLDPSGDFKGKAIVSELLTAAENYRDRLTIILAGYETDIYEKLYSYNDGLRSRFVDVTFEDFSESELASIWNRMLDSKNWDADERLAGFVAKKLSLGANKRGFGNARAVRNIFEAATQLAMSDPNFDGVVMYLKVEFVCGEDPLINPKLHRIIDEFNNMTGWGTIKKAVEQLVQQTSKNYQLSLVGKNPRPIFMNRMFLGNPGTGDANF